MANPTAIGLIRVSTSDQVLGLEAQEADIRKAAAGRGIDVLSIVTEVVSGGAPIEDRYGLAEAIAAVKDLRAAHLIVAKRDRLARDPLVALLTERELERAGATLVCCDGSDGDDPGAELMRGILDVVARFERRMIGLRTKAALAALASGGKVLGRPMGRVDDRPRKPRSDKGKVRGPQKHPNPSPRDRSLKWTRISAPTI